MESRSECGVANVGSLACVPSVDKPRRQLGENFFVGLDPDPAREAFDEFPLQLGSPAAGCLDAEPGTVRESAVDLTHPFRAPGQDGLDGAEVLVREDQLQGHAALDGEETGLLERISCGGGVRLHQTAGAQFRSPEPSRDDDEAVAGPASAQVLQDGAAGTARRLTVVVEALLRGVGRTPHRGPAVMGGIVVPLADSLQPAECGFHRGGGERLAHEARPLHPGLGLGAVGESQEAVGVGHGPQRRNGVGRVRVLQVNKFYDPRGGTERVLYDLEDGLREAGHEVGVFACAHPANRRSEGPIWLVDERDYAHPGLGDRVRHAVGTLYDLPARRQFATALDEFAPDVVHLHNIYHQLSPSILDELFERGLPAVMTVHDYKLVCPVYRLYRDGVVCEECVGRRWTPGVVRHRCSRGSLGESALLAVESTLHRWRRSYERAIATFIAPSEFMARVLREGSIAADRIEVCRNAPRQVPAAADPRSRAEQPTLLYAGRLSEEKGVDLAIAGAREYPEVRLRIAGAGPLDAELRSRASGLANVEFLGHLGAGALERERALAWATLVPSRWYENAPLSVIESWWAARPVIGADHGGLSEMLAGGDAGWSVTPSDPAAWIAAFGRVAGARDELGRLGVEARTRAAREHAFGDFLSRTLELYHRAGERTRRP